MSNEQGWGPQNQPPQQPYQQQPYQQAPQQQAPQQYAHEQQPYAQQTPQYGQQPPTASAAAGADRSGIFAILAAVGGLLVGVGSFLPWATITSPFIGDLTVAGTAADGKITLVIGVAILIVAALRLLRPSTPALVQRLTILFGLIVVAVGIMDVINVSSVSTEVGGQDVATVSVGFGLWVVILGGLLAIVGGIVVSRAKAA
jgi:hypothetical protein